MISLRRRTDKLAVASVAICLLCVIITTVVAPTVLRNASTVETTSSDVDRLDSLSRDTAQLAVEAKRLASEIQQSRVRNIRNNCLAQNEKNRDTIAAIDQLTKPRLADATPAEREQIRQGTTGFIFVITKLAPVQDCKALVRKQSKAP